MALIVALYATACRIGEFLSMRASQLRLGDAHPHALVVGKRGKARAVYLPDLAVDHLRAYLDEYHGGSPRPDAYVFYSRNSPASERTCAWSRTSRAARTW